MATVIETLNQLQEAGFTEPQAKVLASVFERIERRFDDVDRRLDAIDARFQAVDARFQSIETRLDLLERQVAEIRTGMRGLYALTVTILVALLAPYVAAFVS